MTTIPVDSIAIPPQFVALCHDWHGDVGCKLYAVSSTGGLTIGNRRPRGCDSDEKWYYTIWCELASDAQYTTSCAHAGYNAEDDGGDGDGHDADYPALVEFEEWVDIQVNRLAAAYGLEDWDGEEG